MRELIPHPLITLGLTFIWLLMTSFSLGHLILGGAIAIAAGQMVSRLHLPRPHIRRYGLVIRLALLVGLDIIRSNIAVAGIILAGPAEAERRSGFTEIVLRLRDRNAIALLAIIITTTPGTAWMEFDPVSGRLLIHVLDLVDPEAFADLIRNRYESALMEIFE